jgi:hypothetical protein
VLGIEIFDDCFDDQVGVRQIVIAGGAVKARRVSDLRLR